MGVGVWEIEKRKRTEEEEQQQNKNTWHSSLPLWSSPYTARLVQKKINFLCKSGDHVYHIEIEYIKKKKKSNVSLLCWQLWSYIILFSSVFLSFILFLYVYIVWCLFSLRSTYPAQKSTGDDGSRGDLQVTSEATSATTPTTTPATVQVNLEQPDDDQEEEEERTLLLKTDPDACTSK